MKRGIRFLGAGLVLGAIALAGACSEPSTETPSTMEETAGVAEAVIPVTGMTCESCENFLKQTLERTSGVKTAQASHIERRIEVTYDPAAVSVEDLVAEINKTDYVAYMPGTELPASAPAGGSGEGMH